MVYFKKVCAQPRRGGPNHHGRHGGPKHGRGGGRHADDDENSSSEEQDGRGGSGLRGNNDEDDDWRYPNQQHNRGSAPSHKSNRNEHDEEQNRPVNPNNGVNPAPKTTTQKSTVTTTVRL